MNTPSKYTMVSSVNGKIKQLLVVLPYGDDGENICKILETLMLIMEEVEFVIIEFIGKRFTKTDYLQRLEKAAKESGNTINHKSIKVDFPSAGTCWARDPFMTVYSEDPKEKGKLLIPSHAHFESKDRVLGMGSLIGAQLQKFDAVDSELVFEGGNILKAEDFYLVGGDSIYINIEETLDIQSHGTIADELGGGNIIPVQVNEISDFQMKGMTRFQLDDVPENYETPFFPEADRSILVWIRIINSQFADDTRMHKAYNWMGKMQPLFHIDLFVTILGKDEAGKTIIFVGDPVSGVDEDVLEASPKTKKVLDAQLLFARNGVEKCRKNMEASLQALGVDFEVVKIPLPLTYIEEGNIVSWYFTSYNNCLIEIYGGEKIVYLPTYGNDYAAHSNDTLMKTDKKAIEIYEKHGFEVRKPKGDFLRLARRGGSLHCITQDLYRTKSHYLTSKNLLTMSTKKVTIEKDDKGIYTISAGNGTTKLDAPSSHLCIKMADDELEETICSVNGWVRTEMTFKDSDSPVLQMEISKRDGEHILKVIGSEDFRDARMAGIPEFYIQEQYVSISIDDCRNGSGDKLLVFKTY